MRPTGRQNPTDQWIVTLVSKSPNGLSIKHQYTNITWEQKDNGSLVIERPTGETMAFYAAGQWSCIRKG